jgi:hypothetical protein
MRCEGNQGAEELRLLLFLLRQFHTLASPVVLARQKLGALTQPRSPMRETYELETALDYQSPERERRGGCSPR